MPREEEISGAVVRDEEGGNNSSSPHYHLETESTIFSTYIIPY